MKSLSILLGIVAFSLANVIVLPVFAGSMRETALVKAIERAKSAVVDIHTEKTESDAVFGIGKGKKVTGMGAGIVVDPRGYILTNYHVVTEVDSLEISLLDGKRHTAKVITFDRQADLALIKVEGMSNLQVMPIGTSSDLMLGETVIAVGNPYGYAHTITSGIVSYISRDVEANETQKYRNLIQTDASINPGNSGGPLLNLDGEVIGINVAIRAGAQRIGFAIPIDDARAILAKLISSEVLDGTSHGVVTKDFKKATDRKLLIDSVTSGTPAAKAGMLQDDIILSVDQEPVVDRADFERLLLGKSKTPINVIVKRGNEEIPLQLQLQKAGQNDAIASVEKPGENSSSSAILINSKAWTLFGIKVSPMPENTQVKLPGKYKGGMIVTDVRQQSPAAFNGIRQGDILVGLHVWETVKIEDLSYIIDHGDLAKFNPMRFYILRNNETLYGDLRLNNATITQRPSNGNVTSR
jgi:serine protease Do